MKRLITCLVIFILLLGCTDAQATIKKPTSLLQVGKETVTDADIYDMLLQNYGVEAVMAIVNDYIYQQIEDPDADLWQQAQDYVVEAEWRETVGEDYYEYFGYTSESALLEVLIQEFKMEAIIKSYVDENFEQVVESYLPTKLAILQFEDIDDAVDVIAAVKNGQSMDKLADKFHATEDFSGEEEIFSTNSWIPEEVKSYGLYATAPAITDSPIAAVDLYYYVVQVIDVDRAGYKDEIVQELAYDDKVAEDAILFYCRQFNLTYYDKVIMDLIYRNNPTYLP